MEIVSGKALSVLYRALKNGMPLELALAYAQITPSIYTYLLALASVSNYHIEKERLDLISDACEGDNNILNTINDTSVIGFQFFTPNQPTIDKYQSNMEFKKLCDYAFKTITDINRARVENIYTHLKKVNNNGNKTKGGRIDARASMWYLERTLPEYFGEQEIETPPKAKVMPIEIEYVNPDDANTRITDMINEIVGDIKTNA